MAERSSPELTPALARWGWADCFATAFQPFADRGWVPGRVSVEHRGELRVLTECGELGATVAGRLQHRARSEADLPAVGDWVALQMVGGEKKAKVEAVLPRRSKFSRKIPGREDEEQVVAANIDFLFILNALPAGLNLRRLERYLALAWESGAQPVILLTKSDLASDGPDARRQIQARMSGVPVHLISAQTGDGMDELRPYVSGPQTVALLGPSGVGKSTVVNWWTADESLEVQDVRASDQKGRHTTTRRQLVVLPTGGLVIDTPGMRELQIWEAGQGIGDAFPEIDELSTQCKFTDCMHDQEPGCAVRQALSDGRLQADRLASFMKLRAEAEARAQRARRSRSARNRPPHPGRAWRTPKSRPPRS